MESKWFFDEVYGWEEMVPFKCACCEKCWLIVTSRRRAGVCKYGGPYRGYVHVRSPGD